MLGLLLGVGAFGFGLGAAIRMKRKLGISAEDYARQFQEFRTRHQPPPSGGGPAPYVSCVPSYPDRKAIDDICKILDAMGRAGSLAEQEVYKDAFRTAWGKLLEGQKRCMEGWIRDSCPRLEPTLAQLQAIALPPAGPAPPPVRGMTPTRAVVPVPGGGPRVHLPVGHDPRSRAHVVRTERHAQTRAGRAGRFGGYGDGPDRAAHGHAAGPAERERASRACRRRNGLHGDVVLVCDRCHLSAPCLDSHGPDKTGVCEACGTKAACVPCPAARIPEKRPGYWWSTAEGRKAYRDARRVVYTRHPRG